MISKHGDLQGSQGLRNTNLKKSCFLNSVLLTEYGAVETYRMNDDFDSLAWSE